MIDSVTVVSREELRTAIENGYPLIYAHNGAKRWIKRRFENGDMSDFNIDWEIRMYHLISDNYAIQSHLTYYVLTL